MTLRLSHACVKHAVRCAPCSWPRGIVGSWDHVIARDPGCRRRCSGRLGDKNKAVTRKIAGTSPIAMQDCHETGLLSVVVEGDPG